MKTIETLKTEIGNHVTKIDEIKAAAKEEERDLTKEDFDTIKPLLDKISELRDELKILERMKDTEDLVKPETKPAEEKRVDVVHDEADYRDIGEFMYDVIQAGTPSSPTRSKLVDYQKRAASGGSEAVPSDGGFLIPETFSSEIIKKVYEVGTLASRARRLPLGPNSNRIAIPYVNETSRADGSRMGGVRAYWANEAASVTATKMKFGKIEMALEKLFATSYLTDELIQDTTALAGWVNQAFSDELAFKLDDAIIAGTGSGQPLGILNGACFVSITAETGQASTTILAENILKMYGRLWPRSRTNAVWIANIDTFTQLATMELAVGTGGVPLWMPANGLAGRPNDSLMGIPILWHESCPTLGTVGDIMLADMSQYLLIEKGMKAAQSIHVRFIYEETTMRYSMRVNGQPAWQSALTPKSGSSNTLSPFLGVASR